VKEADSIKKELHQLWIDLSRRLDALSNFHFTPKPIVKDALVVANTAAISLEEVIPVGVSSSATLAPEQVVDKRVASCRCSRLPM
jgi:U3 small nucleolar RNA-associated protein MPP10